MTRRSQLEALGLVIVVMLVALGMLFIIIFIVQDDGDTPTVSTKQKELANNFLGAMMLTNVPDCKNFTLTELYIDCAEGSIIDCGNGVKSCQKANDTVEYMLKKTLTTWGKDYNFTATSKYTGDSKVIAQKGTHPCVELEKGFRIYPTDYGVLFITLDVCYE